MITLDDIDCPSDNVKSDIKVLAYLVYDAIFKMEDSYDSPILYKNRNLITNDLLERKDDGKYTYMFLSDKEQNIDYRFYEPFLISSTSFGFTVYDGTISDGDIATLLDMQQKFMKFNYNFFINSFTYDKDEERFETINKISGKDSDEDKKNNGHARARFAPLFSSLGIIGR